MMGPHAHPESRLRHRPAITGAVHPAVCCPPAVSPNAFVSYVADLEVMFYALPDHGTGGPLHILTDDDNSEDHWLDDLMVWALHVGDAAAVVLLWLMGWLSPSQREKANRLAGDRGRYGWPTPPPLATADYPAFPYTPTGPASAWPR